MFFVYKNVQFFLSEVKFAFDVYDFKGDGKVDGFYIGDLLRACNLNPTLLTIDEVGGMKEKGKKIMVIDDFYPIFAKVKLAKGTGGIHDFVEILKLYDKNEDGTILGNELFRLLTNLGKLITLRWSHGNSQSINLYNFWLDIYITYVCVFR